MHCETFLTLFIKFNLRSWQRLTGWKQMQSHQGIIPTPPGLWGGGEADTMSRVVLKLILCLLQALWYEDSGEHILASKKILKTIYCGTRTLLLVGSVIALSCSPTWHTSSRSIHFWPPFPLIINPISFTIAHLKLLNHLNESMNTDGKDVSLTEATATFCNKT